MRARAREAAVRGGGSERAVGPGPGEASQALGPDAERGVADVIEHVLPALGAGGVAVDHRQVVQHGDTGPLRQRERADGGEGLLGGLHRERDLPGELQQERVHAGGGGAHAGDARGSGAEAQLLGCAQAQLQVAAVAGVAPEVPNQQQPEQLPVGVVGVPHTIIEEAGLLRPTLPEVHQAAQRRGRRVELALSAGRLLARLERGLSEARRALVQVDTRLGDQRGPAIAPALREDRLGAPRLATHQVQRRQRGSHRVRERGLGSGRLQPKQQAGPRLVRLVQRDVARRPLAMHRHLELAPHRAGAHQRGGRREAGDAVLRSALRARLMGFGDSPLDAR